MNYGFIPNFSPDFLATGGTGNSHNWIKDRDDALNIAKGAIVAAQATQAVCADRGR